MELEYDNGIGRKFTVVPFGTGKEEGDGVVLYLGFSGEKTVQFDMRLTKKEGIPMLIAALQSFMGE